MENIKKIDLLDKNAKRSVIWATIAYYGDADTGCYFGGK